MITGAGAGAGIVTGGTANALITREWVGAWSNPHSIPGPTNPVFVGFTDQSVRMIIRTSISGESVRIRLANTFGDRHMTVGHATVALPEADTPTVRNDVEASSIRNVTFGGAASVLIPKGSEVLSDPVPMAVAALQELVVSIYLPTPTGPPTWHTVASAFVYVGNGDLAADPSETGFTTLRTNTYFLSGVDVLTRKALGAVVTLGDSIVDGAFSTFNGYTRWPDRLADRLQAEKPLGPIEIAVLNQGLGGNHLIHDGTEPGVVPAQGVNAIARLDRDVFGQPGVRAVFVCLGVNDIQSFNEPAAAVIAAYKQIVAQLRAKNLIAIGCTILPFEGWPTWSPEKETTRLAVNAYLRGANDFHTVVDFDAVVRDPT